MNKKYKLAILTSHPIQYQAPLFRKLAQHPEIDLMVYFCSDYGVTEKVDAGFGIAFKWDIPLLDGYPYKFLKNFFLNPSPGKTINPGIITELWRNRYDALLIHGYTLVTNWIATFGARLTRTPIIFRGETILKEKQSVWKKSLKRIILPLFFRQISAFLPIGTKSREFYRYYGIPEEKMFLAPYSVDNDFFLKQADLEKKRIAETKKEIGVSNDMPVILYVSKLIQRKRPFDLLKAFERLNRQAALVFVGDGELREPMEKYVIENRLKNIFFLGFKNQTELPRYYATSDIFVLPSSCEPWGLVINEAMCFGLPIITTNAVASAADLVKEGENGFIYNVGDIDRLAEALKSLIENPERRKSMGENSKRIISTWNYDMCETGILRALKFVSNK